MDLNQGRVDQKVGRNECGFSQARATEAKMPLMNMHGTEHEQGVCGVRKTKGEISERSETKMKTSRDSDQKHRRRKSLNARMI